MFSPIYSLFEYSADGKYTLQICPRSDINPEHLDYFRFVGRVVGTAIFHQRFLDAFFVTPFYKGILGMPCNLDDLQTVDEDLHRGIQWMLQNDVEGLMYTFSVDVESFGEVSQRDLIPDGRNVDVTNENKHDYIKMITAWRTTERTREQQDSFNRGLYEIIPRELISIFDERELELLIGGIAEIDLDDLRRNTDYRNCSPADPQIKWFWEVMETFTNEQKTQFLQFVTGTARVPVNGFKGLQGSDGPRKFTIELIAGDANRLPMSHTCFNRIDIPRYSSKEQMEQKLPIAIMQTTGFSMQ